jgi:hypothetical protein
MKTPVAVLLTVALISASPVANACDRCVHPHGAHHHAAGPADGHAPHGHAHHGHGLSPSTPGAVPQQAAPLT